MRSSIATPGTTAASPWSLAGKSLVLLLALLLPGGSLLLLGMATWRTVKAAQERRTAAHAPERLAA